MTPADAPRDVGRALPFVGRWSELSWLSDLMARAREGVPHIALIVGEPGVGKSTLAREAVSELNGAQLAVGRCRETMPVAYSPFRDSLFPLLDRFLGDHPDQARYRDLVAQLTDVIISDVGNANELEAKTHQRLVDASILTVELGRERPLVMVLDDIHWADDATLRFLEVLGAQMADASLTGDVPVLVIATLRPPQDDDHQAVVERIEREPIATSHLLRGLPRLDLGSLAQTVAGRPLTERELTRLLEATDGNPLYAGAVLRHGHGQKLPVHIRDAIAAPAESMSPSARRTLQAASFLDDHFSVTLLAEVVGRAAEGLSADLEEGVATGVLDVTEGTWAFSHGLYRRLFRESTTENETQQIRARIAAAMVAEGDADPRVLASHLAGAGDLVADHDVVAVAMRAGRLEFQACNWARACDHYSVVGQRCDDARAEELGIDLAVLHHEFGDALYLQGEPAEAASHLREAAVRYERRGDVVNHLLTLVSMCQIEVTSGELGSTVESEQLRRALQRAQQESPQAAAEAMATLGQIHWVAGRLDDAVRASGDAIRLAHESGNDEVEVAARVLLAMVAWTRFEPVVARQELERAQELAPAASHPARRVGALNRLPLTLLWLGEIEEAGRVAQRAVDIGDSIRFRREFGLPVTAQAMIDALRGDLLHAEYLIERALMVDRMTSYSWASVFARPLLAVVCDLRGRSDEAAAAIDDLEAMMGPTSNWTRAARLLHQASAVRRGEATDPGDVAVGLDVDAAPSIGVAGLAAAHVVLADALDQPEIARHAVGLLRAAAGRRLVYIASVGVMVERALGMALVLEGDLPTGIAYLESALHRATNDGAAIEIARAKRDLARALRRRDGAGDADRAASLLREQVSLCEVLGLDGLLAAPPTPLTPIPGSSADLHPSVVMIVDVCDSTALAQRVGDVAYAHELREVLGRVYAVVDDHGGRVINHTGDGALVTFDGASAAIDCAEACHSSAESSIAKLHLGLHAGEVVELDGNVFGAAVNTAARLCDQAGPRETAVSEAIRELDLRQGARRYDDRGQPALKGLSEPVQVYVVTSS